MRSGEYLPEKLFTFDPRNAEFLCQEASAKRGGGIPFHWLYIGAAFVLMIPGLILSLLAIRAWSIYNALTFDLRVACNFMGWDCSDYHLEIVETLAF